MIFSTLGRYPSNEVDAQLYYDYISQMAFVSSAVFNGTLPSRYASPEAAASAARQVVAAAAQLQTGFKHRAIRIWMR